MLTLKQACATIAEFYKKDIQLNVDFGSFPQNGTVVKFSQLQFGSQQVVAQAQLIYGNTVHINQETMQCLVEFWFSNLTFDTRLVSVTAKYELAPTDPPVATTTTTTSTTSTSTTSTTTTTATTEPVDTTKKKDGENSSDNESKSEKAHEQT